MYFPVPYVRLSLLLLLLSVSLAYGDDRQVEHVEGEEVEYRIGVGDFVLVRVWGRPDLTGPVEVGVEGEVRLPVIGRIAAEGYTEQELANELLRRFRVFDPGISDVIVSIAEYRSRTIAVVGSVNNPGNFYFRHIPDIWGVLLSAGGATSDADLAGVLIVPKEPRGDEARSVQVDLSGGIEQSDSIALPVLKPDDTIVVPSLSDQSGTDDKVRVLGAVRSPGLYRIKAVESAIDAIALSGGTLESADLTKVRLTRRTGTEVVAYQLDLEAYLLEASPNADLLLRPGDTVTVPRKRSFVESALSIILRVAPVVTVGTSLIIALNQ